jgi:hypothetical protein
MILRVLRFSGLAAALCLSGCAINSVPTHTLPTVSKMPDVNPATKKPSVYVDVKYFNGNPADYEMPEDEEAILPLVDSTLNKSNMFSHITSRVTQATDLRMRVIVYFTRAYYTQDECRSVSLFPCLIENRYHLVVKIRDNTDTVLTTAENDDGVDTSSGLPSQDTVAMSYDDARSITLENQLRAALAAAYASGKIAVPAASAAMQ